MLTANGRRRSERAPPRTSSEVIEADPTGGPLGSALCAVANLLNAGVPPADSVALLNQIPALL